MDANIISSVRKIASSPTLLKAEVSILTQGIIEAILYGLWYFSFTPPLEGLGEAPI
jgi:hypothetical protein